LLLATSWFVFAGGCGPGVATPMPEPPSLIDPTLLGAPEITPAVASPGFVDIAGRPGAAPPNATVRVTNLDGQDLPYSTTAYPDGHFLVSVAAADGNELRFEWLTADQRSAPSDVLFLQPGSASFSLQPSPRFDCVELSPGFVLDFATTAADTVPLQIKNQCASALSIGAVTLRRGSPDFAPVSDAVGAFPPGSVATITVAHTATSANAAEDTLFVSLSQGGTVIRYPITLSARP